MHLHLATWNTKGCRAVRPPLPCWINLLVGTGLQLLGVGKPVHLGKKQGAAIRRRQRCVGGIREYNGGTVLLLVQHW